MKKLLFVALLFCVYQIKAQAVITPSICMVTTDSAQNNNIIYWDKTGYQHVDSFIVYRETSTNVYSRIGAQPYAALSAFVDTARSVGGPFGGDPKVGEYRYKLQMRDSSGIYSALSPYNTTIYLTTNASQGAFYWTAYMVEGVAQPPFAYFALMRDDNSTGNFAPVGSTASTQLTLIDPNYNTYAASATWRIDAVGFNCTPTLRQTNNSTQAAATVSHSNLVVGQITAIKNISTALVINMYPNPAVNNVTITSNYAGKQVLQLVNAIGNIVLTQSIGSQTIINTSNLSSGIYYVNISSNEGTVIKKLIISN